jgi:hypothetical protein
MAATNEKGAIHVDDANDVIDVSDEPPPPPQEESISPAVGEMAHAELRKTMNATALATPAASKNKIGPSAGSNSRARHSVHASTPAPEP